MKLKGDVILSKIRATILIGAALAAAIPAIAQLPGAADPSRITAGTYKVDPNHTQVVWTVNHMGITPLTGAFGASGGTLELDPANPSAAKVTVTFTVADMSTTAPAFTKHLLSADFFEAEKYPTATFTSTAVKASGTTATITGNLTLKGVTKPVTLNAKFFGAGANPRNKKTNVGFEATTTIKRGDFGIGYGLPMVPDPVELRIYGAFESAS